MSSNPVLDDDDILLIPAAEEAADKDIPTSSSISHGSVYPRWTENPNRLPIPLTSRPATLPSPAPTHGIELQATELPAGRRTVIQIPGGLQRGGLSPVSADPPVSFTGAYVVSCVVYWCFCLVLGSIAYVIAAIGENHAYDGNIATAHTWRKASFTISGVGIVLGIVLLIVIFAVILPVYGYKKT